MVKPLVEQTPRELLEEALCELATDDPRVKARACDKGWHAAINAMELFLATRGKQLPPYSGAVHHEYGAAIWELSQIDPSLEHLDLDWSHAAQTLSVACFCHRDDTRLCKGVLDRNVRAILEATGNWEVKSRRN